MKEKTKVAIVNLITGSRVVGTFALPFVSSLFGPVGTALFIGGLWITDALDGYLAKRKWHVSTIFGANLDAFSDKLFGIATLIYLSKFFPIVVVPLVLEFGIFGVNWHYGRKGADVKSSTVGKRKTLVFDIVTAFSVLTTLSLTSVFANIVPLLMSFVCGMQAYTLKDYINTHKTYLRHNKPKNDVSHLGFIETIKAIVKLLGDEKIYSPAYYKDHKNEPLLDMLLNKKEENQLSKTEELPKIENKQSNMDEEDYTFNIQQKNELKIVYSLNDNEIEKLEAFAETHKLDPDLIMSYLSKYINTVNPTNYPTVSEMENFIIEEEQEIIKKKGFKEMS